MVILVTGDRHYTRKGRVNEALTAIHEKYGIHLLVHGAATGADTLAENWARRNEIEYHGYPAQWGANSASAGPLRNQRMLDKEPVIDLVVAFHDTLDWSKGTKDMTQRAYRRAIPTILVEKDTQRWLTELRPL